MKKNEKLDNLIVQIKSNSNLLNELNIEQLEELVEYLATIKTNMRRKNGKKS